mgnify:CR=1 FL=1
MGLKETVENLHRFIDRAIVWTGGNAGHLLGSYALFDSADTDMERIAITGGAAVGAWALNKYILPAMDKVVDSRTSVIQTGVLTACLMGSCYVGATKIDDFRKPEKNCTAISYTSIDNSTLTNPTSPETNNTTQQDTIKADTTQPQGTTEGREEADIGYKAACTDGVPVDLGTLAGKDFSGLLTDFTGIEGKAPQNATIDFEGQLQGLWQKKLAKMEKRGWENDKVNDFYEDTILSYDHDDDTRMRLTTYMQNIDKTIEGMIQSLDWDSISKRKRLTSKKGDILKDIASSFEANDLVSYMLNEIMPPGARQRNLDVLDMLVSEAGETFISLIPSLHDPLVSLGPYQVTKYTVNEEGTGGASALNFALPKDKRLPDSVQELTPQDHHVASYLFAINNLADALRQTKDISSLKDDGWRAYHDEIVAYCSTAHHHPAASRRAFAKWVENDMRHPYVISCSKQILSYARKALDNRRAVLQRFDGDFREMSDDTSKGILYTVKEGDTLAGITRKFDEHDMRLGDRYEDLSKNIFKNKTYMNIRDPGSGQYVGETIRPGQTVMITAERKSHS